MPQKDVAICSILGNTRQFYIHNMMTDLVIGGFMPKVADFVLDMARSHDLAKRNASKIQRALLVELRCNLELLELVGEKQPDPALLREILAILQLDILQAVFGLDVEDALSIKTLDKQIKKLILSNDSESARPPLPIDLSGQPVSAALDYLLRKGVEMKAIAALSDKAVLALPKSINWRKRLGNYRQVLLFTIQNLKSKK